MKVALNELLAGIETLALSPYVREIWILFAGEWVNIAKPVIYRGLISGSTADGLVMIDKDEVQGLRFKLVRDAPAELHYKRPHELIARFEEDHRRWKQKAS